MAADLVRSFCPTVSAVYTVPFISVQGGLYEAQVPLWQGPGTPVSDLGHVGSFFSPLAAYIKAWVQDTGTPVLR